VFYPARLASLLIILISVSSLIAEEPSKITPEQVEFFEKKIRPVLANNCYECHGPETQEASLRLDKYAFVTKGGDTGPAVVPGKPDQSEIVDAILYDPTGYQMPPDGKLPQRDIENLIAWIKMGAPWPGAEQETVDTGPSREFDITERLEHWSYQPVQTYEPPAVKQQHWVKTPVDRFVLDKLNSAGLSPAAPADKRTLLRRVTFDLIGLPPTRQELDEFLADDSPEAFAKVVDRLLNNPAYGERWGRHWLDLVRFAETAGHEFDYEIPHAWRYRDYVIRALNNDLPYNRFLIEHLAGDLLENPRRFQGYNESILATGFYWFAQGKHSPVDIRMEECDTVDNQIDVIGRAFLGSSIACARCHDHKFDPISTRDYYAMAGFLQSSRRDTAMINPPEVTTELARELRRLQEEITPQLKQATRQNLTIALNNLSQQLKSASAEWVNNPEAEGWPKFLTHTAAKNEHHPLYLWSQLGHVSDPDMFHKRKARPVRPDHGVSRADLVEIGHGRAIAAEVAVGAVVGQTAELFVVERAAPPARAARGLINADAPSRRRQPARRRKARQPRPDHMHARHRGSALRPGTARKRKTGPPTAFATWRGSQVRRRAPSRAAPFGPDRRHRPPSSREPGAPCRAQAPGSGAWPH